MANVFFRQNKMDIANSLYAKVTSAWRASLLRSLHKHQQRLQSQPETAPFTEAGDAGAELLTGAQRAEAMRVLSTVLEIRQQAPKQQPGETTRVLHALAVLHYLLADFPKAREMGVKAFELAKQLPQGEPREAIGHLLKLIDSDASRTGWTTPPAPDLCGVSLVSL